MSLRVLTFNVWGLPWPGARDLDARMDALAARIPELDVDLIGLQEVWSEDARARLVSAARAAGFEHVWHREAAQGGSGLVLLSRLPIRSARFTRYLVAGLPQRIQHLDYYAGKGFVVAEVATPDGVVAVANTHLHATYPTGGYAAEYRGTQAAQVIELAAGLSQVQLPLVALGDFNLQEGSALGLLLHGLTGLTDSAAALDRRMDTSLGDNPYRGRGHARDSRIDYVFVRNGEGARVRPVRVERLLDDLFEIDGHTATYSDHAAVRAELELSPSAGAMPPAPQESAFALGFELLGEGRQFAEERTRSQRIQAGVWAAAAIAALAGARTTAVSRRRFLRGTLLAGGAASAAAALGTFGLSELFAPEELRRFDEVAAALEALKQSARVARA